ncbi:MAG: polysaccharide export protein [Rhodospirillales bacterium]|nr:polysaccharide export protein [Rhodospirillales bacterium]
MFDYRALAVGLLGLSLAGCAISSDLPPAPAQVGEAGPSQVGDYLIGPGDQLQIFVWRNPELTTQVKVRPDGRISVPLIDDMETAGRSPTELSRDIEKRLAKYVEHPIVSVIVSDFIGPFDQQVRVVGEAAKPQAIPYRANMSILDVIIQVGGMTEFASGNRAVIVRHGQQGKESYRVRLDDLIRDGDVSANVAMRPGDIVIIPQSWF